MIIDGKGKLHLLGSFSILVFEEKNCSEKYLFNNNNTCIFKEKNEINILLQIRAIFEHTFSYNSTCY